MKNILKYLLSAFALVVIATSCKKDENKVYYEGGTPPVLTSTVAPGGTIPLSFLNKDLRALKLSWTNPAYRFTTGTSSQDVSYQIEIDTAGSNFTNPNRKVITVSNDLSLDITQNDFNDYLLNQLVLNTTMNHQIQIRVKSTMANGSAPLYSNILSFVARPYPIPPKVTPPSTGKLYLVGNATPGGWNNPVPVPSQEFTQVSPTFYTITIPLTAGGSYLMLPLNGDWGTKYGGVGSSNNSNNPNGDDFKMGGSDLLAPSVGGNYKIDVDFQRGKFTLTKL